MLATQNPIEMEGTYPLPEAQLDRFMFNVIIDYLPEDDEVAVVQPDDLADDRSRSSRCSTARTCCSSTRSCARCRSPRTSSATPCGWPPPSRPGPQAPDFINDWVSWGAGLRAGQSLVLGAKARALLRGPVPRHARRHPRPRPPHAPPPHPPGLSRRGRRRDRRQRDRPPAGTPERPLHLMSSPDRDPGPGPTSQTRRGDRPAHRLADRPADPDADQEPADPGPGRRRGVHQGHPPQPLSRLLGRVQRVPRVQPGRRPAVSSTGGCTRGRTAIT